MQLRLAALLEDTLHRDPQAVQRYEAVLARVPGHPAALAGLGRLHAKTQDWPALVAVYDAELAAVGRPADPGRAPLSLRRRSSTPACGAPTRRWPASARRSSSSRATSRPGRAWSGCCGARSAGRELIALHEEELLSITAPADGGGRPGPDRPEAEEHLGNLDARLRGAPPRPGPRPRPPPLAGPPRAARRSAAAPGTSWCPCSSGRPSSPPSRPRPSPSATVPHRCWRNASDDSGRRHRRARAAPRRRPDVRPRAPGPGPALRPRGAVEGAGGDVPPGGRAGRIQPAPSSSGRGSPTSRSPGSLDLDAARAAWDEVLRRDPDHGAALRALARIQRGAGRLGGAGRHARAEAQARTDPRARADAPLRGRHAAARRLADREAAAATLEAVLRLAPDHLPALRELESLSGPEPADPRRSSRSSGPRVAGSRRGAGRGPAAAGPRPARRRTPRARGGRGRVGAGAAAGPPRGPPPARAHPRRRPGAARRRPRSASPTRVHEPGLAAALRLSAELEQARPRQEERLEQLRRAFDARPGGSRAPPSSSSGSCGRRR